MKNSQNLLVTVLDTSFFHEIQMAKSLLERNNIVCYIFNENMGVMIGTAISEGHKLKVNKSDVEKAKAILEKMNENDN